MSGLGRASLLTGNSMLLVPVLLLQPQPCPILHLPQLLYPAGAVPWCILADGAVGAAITQGAD
jgi:hypothetical protein